MRNHETAYQSVVEVIGQTPLLALDRMTRGTNGRILAKLELLNPGFSIKDRFARQVIEDAERSGSLRAGQTVVELTSGNAGTGLAIVCAVKGYPFVAVMSKGNSAERARMMSALGAEVVLVDQCPGGTPGQVSGEDLALVEREAARITDERGAFRADQFKRASNVRGHELHTGPEIWAQSGGSVTAFCSFVGSGGTFVGVRKALKARNPLVRCYVVEPQGAQVLAGKALSNASHRIQGGGYAMPSLPLLADTNPDGFVSVTDDEAMDAARRLAREEGVFGGFSAGANVAAALKLLRGSESGGIIATVICDSGLKYLSTDLWSCEAAQGWAD
jgi:cysteine synthase A